MRDADGSLSAVTVVFEAEVPLLELQARSMARHVPVDVFDEILVIDNTRRGLPDRARRRLLAEFGDHADRIAFASRADLSPTAPDMTGWRTQQCLKLMAARRLTSGRYVVLDAKNHFIRTTTRRDFLDPATGLPHGGLHSFAEHPLRPQLELVAYGLGLDPAATVERFTATVPPIVLDREVVTDLLVDVGRGEPDRFPGEFARSGYTEFFLYSAWQIARGATPEGLVSGQSLVSPTVWVGACSADDVRGVLARAEAGPTTTLAIHRRALARIDREAIGELAAFWTAHGLFPSQAEAERFIHRFRVVYLRAMGVRRLRERMTR